MLSTTPFRLTKPPSITMPPRRTYHRHQQPPRSFSLPYLGPPPTGTPVPPSSTPTPSQPALYSAPLFTPHALNTAAPSSSTPPKPLPSSQVVTSQPMTPSPLGRHPNPAESRYTLPPISPSERLPPTPTNPTTNPPLRYEIPTSWPPRPLYATTSPNTQDQLDSVPRLPGMEVIVVSDNEGIQQPLRKRRREASAARRQRRRRAEYRLREAAVVEAARAVDIGRTAQYRSAGMPTRYVPAPGTGMVIGDRGIVRTAASPAGGTGLGTGANTGMGPGLGSGLGTGLRAGLRAGLGIGARASLDSASRTGIGIGMRTEGRAGVGSLAGPSSSTGLRRRVQFGQSIGAAGAGSSVQQVSRARGEASASTNPNMPRIPASLESARVPTTREESARLMRELRETALALHGMGMSEEAQALVRRTLPKLLRED